jgi:DNA-binding beta-propeller fold protein YncE
VLRALVSLGAVAVLALVGGDGRSARAGGTPVALVTAETLNQLIAVELPSGRVLRRLRMPTDPQNVETGPRYAVVVSPAAGAVTILNVQKLRVRKVLRGFGSPHIALVLPFPRRELAYVTDDSRGQLDVIQLREGRVLDRVFVGRGAHHMSLSPDRRRLWVALGERARAVAVVDTSHAARPRLLGHLDPHGLAHDVAFDPRGANVWVTYDDRSAIGIFDARSGRLLRTLPAGSPPQHVAFDPFSLARQAYVTSGNDGTLRIVSLKNNRLVRLVRVPYGSFNLGLYGSFVATSSLYRGTLTDLVDTGRKVLVKRVAPASRDVAVAVL